MVASSPRFSKKPRSSATGSASMSIALTMPTFSLTGVCALAGAHASNSAAPSSINRFISSSLFYRPYARDPVRPGHRVEIRSFDASQFYRMALRAGDPSILLERQNVKTFGREWQLDLDIDLFGRAVEFG